MRSLHSHGESLLIVTIANQFPSSLGSLASWVCTYSVCMNPPSFGQPVDSSFIFLYRMARWSNHIDNGFLPLHRALSIRTQRKTGKGGKGVGMRNRADRRMNGHHRVWDELEKGVLSKRTEREREREVEERSETSPFSLWPFFSAFVPSRP